MQQANSQTTVQWEWKSNPNPYSRVEKAQWTPYNPLDNYLLERAHYNQQQEVDLGGDYIVSIKDMLQKKKNDTFRQRPIRRNTEYFKNQEEEKKLDQDENIRAKRFFGAEAPKTFNKAFGNLSDYLKFFQNRGPDIRELINLFTDIEATNNLDLLNEIIQPHLIQSLQSEANKISALTNDQRYYIKKLLELFRGPLPSIKQFYAHILKAYTMEGFLYGHLNSYLRNEDWNQLDSLLFYAYCLCKAFLRAEFTTSNINNPIEADSKMIVYRGAQFDEIALSFYDTTTLKNFCWNAVTSTSRSRQVAENFMYYNFDPKKVPVLFIIEVPQGLENSNKWIDIKPYSAIPNEDEVVLSPGSVFELINVSKASNKGVEISLKLMINVDKLAHQGQIMHAALHSEMANDTRLKLVCLEGRELSDALAHLKGNRMIEEIEFCLCKFDEKFNAASLREIPNLKNLTFVSPLSGNQAHWSAWLNQLKKGSVEKLETVGGNLDDKNFFLFGQGIRSLDFLKSLSLDLNREKQVTDEGLSNLSLQGLKYLTSLRSLTINFERCDEMTDVGLQNLSSQGLKHLTSLTSLTLNFEKCRQITDAGLNHLGIGLKYLTSMTILTLSFNGCNDITDEGLNHLSMQGLKHLTSLASLTLNFKRCYDHIHYAYEDKPLNHLSVQGLKHLTSLTSLSLCFEEWDPITDEGLSFLSSEALKDLASLKSLTLKFKRFGYITGRGLKNLSTQGLRYLTSLTSLALHFEQCSQISDEGLNPLNTALKSLPLLTSLILNFNYCYLITDEGLGYLSSEAFRNLTLLTSLSLDFGKCALITDEGLCCLSSQGLKYLTSLTSLSLSFEDCYNLTDEGLNHLSFHGLKYLTSLTSLALNFEGCSYLSDKGLNHLSLHGLKRLTSLTRLNLSFEADTRITDEGREVLDKFLEVTARLPCEEDQQVESTIFHRILSNGSQEQNEKLLNETLTTFRSAMSFDAQEQFQKITQNITTGNNHLAFGNISINGSLYFILKTMSLLHVKISSFVASLQCLHLEFKKDQKISEIGLSKLSLHGLKNLASLTSLTLTFHSCKITDEGLNSLATQGLKNITSLTSLTLEFLRCSDFTSEGFKHLSSQGLKHLTMLTALTLRIHGNGMNDEGLEYLSCQGLKNLTSLSSLTLDFLGCSSITDEGLNQLSSQGLKYLILLTSLNLNFEWDGEITDKGLESLSLQGLKHLSSITTLALNFAWCDQITDQGLSYLGSGIKYLTSLTFLNLNLDRCLKIKDEGLHCLEAQGHRYLTSLTLNLDFGWNERLNYLNQFHSLTSLNMSLPCTDKSLTDLSSHGLKYLTSLTSLTLDCKLAGYGFGIGDEGLSVLSSQVLKNLTSLTSLTLNFWRSTITDKGLSNHLILEGLKNLPLLTSLALNFNSGFSLEDEGLKNLGSQGLKHLPSLTSLALSFYGHNQITDEGLNQLSSQGLKHLTLLTSLALNFGNCCRISDEGLNHLGSQGLKHLTSLTSLTLNLEKCDKISDEGLNYLTSQGIKNLISLTSLSLNFLSCSNIHQKAWRNFCQILKYFGFKILKVEPQNES